MFTEKSPFHDAFAQGLQGRRTRNTLKLENQQTTVDTLSDDPTWRHLHFDTQPTSQQNRNLMKKENPPKSCRRIV